MGHEFEHKANFMVEIIQSMFSDPSGIKQEIKKVTRKFATAWECKNTL